MADEMKRPRTPAEIIHQRASDLARDALELQALAALNTDRELLHNLAGWCTAHKGSFFELQYAVNVGDEPWELTVYLGGSWRHHRASGTNTLTTEADSPEKCLVAMLKLLANVAPEEASS